MITIGEKLKALRESQRLSLRDLGEKVDLSASFLSQLELGQVSPSIASIENIANVLNVHITHFFDDPKKTDSVVMRRNERRRIYSKG